MGGCYPRRRLHPGEKHRTRHAPEDPVAIAQHGPSVRQEVVAEGDRLCLLEMGEDRDHQIGGALSEIGQDQGKGAELIDAGTSGTAKVEA